jgi:hypothetical protein
MATTSDSRKRTLGILWLIYGIICVAKAAFIIVEAPVLTLMWGAIITRVPNPFAWMAFFHFMMFAGIALLIVTAVFSFLAAGALMQAQNRAPLAVIAGILAILTGPLGIALGVYTLVLCVSRPAWQTYDRMSAAA